MAGRLWLPRRLDKRHIGMRLWLGCAFALVGLITAAAVYLLVRDSSGRTLTQSSGELAVGRTVRLTDSVAASLPHDAEMAVSVTRTDGYQAWVVGRRGKILSADPTPNGMLLSEVPRSPAAIDQALRGRRFEADLPGNVTVVGVPVIGASGVRGAVISRATPPAALKRSIEGLRGDSVTALALAIGAGILVGFAVASLITIRIKRLATSAEAMAQGRFDEPLSVSGRDELGDLARALDSMREALRESFNMLATERDRLSAILDGLIEAVMVVGDDGEARFSNPAATALISEGKPLASLRPSLRRASELGSAENAWLRVEERVFAVQARRVPAENAVLLVARDRTEELRRELAERDFVSNAAHELRNPLAGLSSAIQVLRGGAKEDDEARDHFLDRLADDADRMTRLTQSLLTLARVEAGQEGENQVVDVNLAAREAVEAVDAPEGVEVSVDAELELIAEGDPVLLRQVLAGLLSNACKNTPAPGTVTLRARRKEEESEVMIEVEDTGTGIAPEEIGRVFDRFYRGSGSLESDGFGLGLAIVKRMVDVMGGAVGVNSSQGEGSTFWVRLRAPQPSPTQMA
jgi:two-component system, OmpR family, phosphate regulon sensor histidine kinase PhoR